MRINELDGRFKGHQYFDYYASLNKYTELELFQEAREWCWNSFGPSSEVEIIMELKQQPKWCWDFNLYHCRILFRDEATMNWFRLKYADTEKIRRL